MMNRQCAGCRCDFHLPARSFRFWLPWVALLLGQPPALAQEPELAPDSLAPPALITSVVITGNRQTKAQIILREIKSQVGTVFDPEVVEADRMRLLNLRLFSRVDIAGVAVADGVQLVITVQEAWYIYPYPIFFMNDRDWGKLSYGAGLLHYNFRGRRETLAISGWAGYNPALQLDYGNPWMFNHANLFGRWSFSAQTERNRYLTTSRQEVNEKRLGGMFTLGKRFGLFNFFSLSFGYSSLRFEPQHVRDPRSNAMLDLGGADNRASVIASYLRDARDFHEYPRRGSYVSLWVKRTGFTATAQRYWRYGGELRRYRKIYRGVALAGRGMADFASRRVPLDDLVNFGFRHRIRGHFYRRLHGENLALASVELRVPLIPLRYHRLEESPLFQDSLIGRYMRTLKFGVSAGLFADYGVIWNHADGFTPDRGRAGFGAGLHLHMPFLNVLRLEAAVNEDGRLEGLVDVGVAF
ncbi:MAG: BamA/TamA family outer membrane protein [candidate division KSB1 bacterium]|nr:BamA/TamA family outer membrane protein [candidate division KSB1 bacterium]MDZ7275689.1 BamA/TamA family outer membrane protein [candidate division KSB1 bacterium]MDZ7284620.1 BamA/TamA family outer membrane protein [candidate division KSB1 bacterium]MDZ7297961.1 BamA/TamA family outer membrane protein [candidate division KSB1 bacterium]MDZ7305871.1 BamA/TamA family outer membrane protein [candidate division KSB1 bacterium]